MIPTVAVISFLAILGVVVWVGRPPSDGEEMEDVPVERGSRRVASEFTVFSNVRLAGGENEEFAGHRFPFNDGDRARYVAHLYFVESPEPVLTEASSRQISKLGRHFGDVELDKLVELGGEARDFTLRKLAERPFRIATTYQPPVGDPGLRASVMAFVLLRNADGSEEYLSEVLVREGYAAVVGMPAHLPFGEPRDAFREYLQKVESEARAQRKGIWAHGRPETAPEPSILPVN